MSFLQDARKFNVVLFLLPQPNKKDVEKKWKIGRPQFKRLKSQYHTLKNGFIAANQLLCRTTADNLCPLMRLMN
jgi:hypothetical protein